MSDGTELAQRSLCGVDGTAASLTAVRQAARLADGGELVLVAVGELAKVQ